MLLVVPPVGRSSAASPAWVRDEEGAGGGGGDDVGDGAGVAPLGTLCNFGPRTNKRSSSCSTMVAGGLVRT